MTRVGLMKRLMQCFNFNNKQTDDFKFLLSVTEANRADDEKFKTMVRACLKSFLNILEADLYFLNKLDAYPNYEDRNDFISKFKKTFKQVTSTWEREKIYNEYRDKEFEVLLKVKDVRDKLIHPKSLLDVVNIGEQDYKDVIQAFEAYQKFLLKLVSNFFIKGPL